MVDQKIDDMDIFNAVKKCKKENREEIKPYLERINVCIKEGQSLSEQQITQIEELADKIEENCADDYNYGDREEACKNNAIGENLRYGLKCATKKS